jgi:hypothetical protein
LIEPVHVTGRTSLNDGQKKFFCYLVRRLHGFTSFPRNRVFGGKVAATFVI